MICPTVGKNMVFSACYKHERCRVLIGRWESVPLEFGIAIQVLIIATCI